MLQKIIREFGIEPNVVIGFDFAILGITNDNRLIYSVTKATHIIINSGISYLDAYEEFEKILVANKGKKLIWCLDTNIDSKWEDTTIGHTFNGVVVHSSYKFVSLYQEKNNCDYDEAVVRFYEYMSELGKTREIWCLDHFHG